jgi:L,D-peptidoglycan transpeptidase YkuD (ErfK/YbiS/YcfS/YnhG family)
MRVLVTIGLLAVVVGACTQEASVPTSRFVNQGSFRNRVTQAHQHLVMVTEEPGNISGRLFRMERVGGEGAWRQVGTPIPVVVGWGGVGPKQEGDGRSPLGVFRVGAGVRIHPGATYGLVLSFRVGPSLRTHGPGIHLRGRSGFRLL